MPLEVTARSSLCLIIGDPVSHSLSPAMHNAAYAHAGIPFVMSAAHVTTESLADAIRGVRALGIRGLAVTMPHKVAIIPMLDAVVPTAQAIGAVNTVVLENGVLTGFNTDWLGILRPLEQRTVLRGKRVALLGAGGAAQAALHACTSQGATVTIFNRTVERAQPIAERFGCTVLPLADAVDLANFDVIINTTAVGMDPNRDQSPIPESAICKHHIIFETIYAPARTKLIQLGEQVGAQTITGLEMFLEQGVAQFQLHTGVKAPREEMEKILRSSLKA
jgi:shikimate dehydrogenase